MPKLTFYHQVRFDGGRRTGVSVDDDADSLHHFEPSDEGEHDPRLLWYVDVRCEGDSLPTQPRQAQAWFVEHGCFFTEGLRQAAASIEVGLDAELWPYRQFLQDAPNGAQCEVVVQAVRRLAGRDVARHVRELAQKWGSILEQLAALEVR